MGQERKRVAITTGPIELETAQKYIENLERSDEFGKLQNFAGTIFHASVMKKWLGQTGFEGIFFWLGYDPQSGGKYMFVENKPNFPYNDDDIETYLPDSSNEIVIGTKNFTSKGENSWFPFLTENEFKNDKLIATEPDILVEHSEQDTLIIWVKEFLKIGKGWLCRVPFGYFSNSDCDAGGNSYLTEFLSDENLQFISVHLGRNSNLYPDCLRLSLIGRGGDGKPLPGSIFQFSILQENRPPRIH